MNLPLALVARAEPSRAMKWASPVMAVALTLLAGAVLLVVALVAVVVWRNRHSLLQRMGWLQEAWLCLSVRPLELFLRSN